MYEKHDSFFTLKHKKNQKNSQIVDRIVKSSKNPSVVKKLSLAHQKILTAATMDLLNNTQSISKTKFNKILKVSKNNLEIERLTLSSQKIFKKVIADLLGDGNINEKIKFNLKSNVIAEINTVSD